MQLTVTAVRGDSASGYIAIDDFIFLSDFGLCQTKVGVTWSWRYISILIFDCILMGFHKIDIYNIYIFSRKTQSHSQLSRHRQNILQQ